MATYQINEGASRVVEGAVMFSVTLFEGEPHDTRDPKKCEESPHTTQEFTFPAGSTRDEVHAAFQAAADVWAESCAKHRAERAALESFL